MYFVASEHIARWKTLYRFLRFAAEPIMRYKGTVGGATVIEALRKIKAGASVCIFAEGVRTWDGVTCPIRSSTGKMVKSARCGLVTYKITGGYFVSPGWSDSGTRKGPLYGSPVTVYTKEQLALMSADEINHIINRDLYEDAYERQLKNPQKYTGNALAEGLENLFYICPNCNRMDSLSTNDNLIRCNSCNMTFTYNEYGMFENAPFQTVREYSLWQQQAAKQQVLSNTMICADYGTLKKIVKHDEMVISEGPVSMDSFSLTCMDFKLSMDSIHDMDITGRHGLVLSVGKDYYELKIPGNAVKFLLYFRIYKETMIKER